MLELPHVLTGVAIAAKVANPALALPLAFASHYVLDLVPHWNPSIYTQIRKEGHISGKNIKFMIIDSGLALSVGSFIALQALPNLERVVIILLGAFLAVLPDVLEIPFYLGNVRSPLMLAYVQFNHKLQSSASLIPGVMTQIIVSLAAFWWIFT